MTAFTLSARHMEIGLDIGLKKVTVVLVDNNRVVKYVKESIYEEKRDSEKIIMEKILTALHKLHNSSVKGIGLSLPSVTDRKKGIVYDIGKIPYWEGAGIKKILEDQFKTGIYVNNDMNCFLLGEKYFGQYGSFKNIVSLFLEHNTGTSILVNNKLLFRNKQSVSERACLSNIYYDSVYFHKKKYHKVIDKLNYLCCNIPDNIYDLPEHKKWNDFGMSVGKLISVLLNNYDPEIIVLGGKLGRLYMNYAGAIDCYLEKIIHSKVLLNMIVVTSEVKNSKAAGAAYMVSHEC